MIKVIDIMLSIWALCSIYFICIDPFIYRWWIIPNIEKRYGKKLVFCFPAYKLNLLPPVHLEMALYIVLALFGVALKSRYEALHKINYDVTTAPKTEIIVSFITIGAALSACLIPTAQYFYYR